MLLRNYDKMDLMRRIADQSDSNSYFGAVNDDFTGNNLSIKDIDGYVKRVYNAPTLLGNFGHNSSMLIISNSVTCLVCGSGSTPVTYDDYKLENILTDTQAQGVKIEGDYNPVYNEETDSWSRTVSRTFLANEDLVINEIGVYQGCTYEYEKRQLVMVYRKVLDTPIEVPAGANFTISFTTNISANQNKPNNYDATASVE